MKNTIQRVVDNHYLISAEADTWTPNLADATKFSEGRTIVARIKLLTRVTVTDFVVLPVEPAPPVEPPVVEPPAPDMSEPTN
jgi:hypothetical protein